MKYKVNYDASPLAVEGGEPIRSAKLASTIRISDETAARLAKLVEGGVYSGWFGGPLCREFEQRFSSYHGSGYECVAANSGTSALHIAIASLDLGPDDEVIVPAAAYQAAASVVLQERAIPVLIDVDEESMTMVPQLLEDAITPRTAAVIVVHFFGVPNNMEAIAAICAERGVTLIEDCAQAHGATVNDRKVGTFGDIACWSFAPRKHLATGEGGMVMARSDARMRVMRQLANRGKGDNYRDYVRVGFSYQMTEFSALLGIDGLEKLDTEIGARRACCDVYREILRSETGISFLTDPSWGRSVAFKFPVVLDGRLSGRLDGIVDAVLAENVGCRPSHPPLTTIGWLREYLASHGRATPSAPVAESVLPAIIELDTGPWIGKREAAENALALKKVLQWMLSKG